MWRAFFLSIGIYFCILGGECLVVDKFVLVTKAEATETPTSATLFGSPPPAAANKEFEPAEWAPWSFLSAGAVIILYALTINRGG
jgi:hypothetical protein